MISKTKTRHGRTYYKCGQCGTNTLDPLHSCDVRTYSTGTVLERIVSLLGLASTNTCNCKSIKHAMNRLGPDGCLERLEYLADAICQSAAKSGRNVNRRWVILAIRTASLISRMMR